KLCCTCFYYIAFSILGLAGAAWGPSLNILAVHTNCMIQEISLIFIALYLGGLAGSFGSGFLFDRLPGHRVLAASLGLMAFFLFLIPMMRSLAALCCLVLCFGASVATLNVGGNVLIIRNFPLNFAPVMNGLHLAAGIGFIISPLAVSWSVLNSGDIFPIYRIFAILSIFTAICLFFLPEPDFCYSSESLNVLSPSSQKIFRLSLLFMVFYGGVEAGFGNWIFNYAKSAANMDNFQAARLNSGFWIAFTFGRFAAIFLSFRLSPFAMLCFDIVGCLLSLSVMAVFSDSSLFILIGSLGFAFSTASVFPSMLSFIQNYMPLSGAVTGKFMIATGIGAMFFPWFIGQLFETVGHQILVFTMLFIFVAVSIILWVIRFTSLDCDFFDYNGLHDLKS
ncbi:MFS transporter, partial [Desulfobacterales bacterium HSG17]|nr:MFS transporter [Desulfobacterales bacterium HSG17]